MNKYLLTLAFVCCSFTFAEERVVVITGGSQGMGFATAQAFQKKGWQVWVTTRSVPEEVSEIHYVQMDVSDDASVIQAVDTIMPVME